MKYALISVSDKGGLECFAKGLIDLGFKILSTGGTSKYLQSHNIEVLDVVEYTNFPEMFDGRVKTLHPKIFSGILYRRENKQDVEDVEKYDIFDIGLVCVNLYPFKKVVESQKAQNIDNFDEIVENIDIGGPSLIRAAAKNFKDIFVVVNPNSYSLVLDSIKNKDPMAIADLKRDLMMEAFNHTAHYEIYIANYMNNKFGDDSNCFIAATKFMSLNYGENPHQSASLYEFDNFYSAYFKVLKGNVGFNNLLDINAALKISTSFTKISVTIVKHNNPCGFGLGKNELEAFQRAITCDPISAYGGVIAINGVVDEALADEVLKSFFEVVVAVGFTNGALQKFESKKRLKLITCSKDNRLIINDNLYDIRKIENGLLRQTKDRIEYAEVENAILKTKASISKERYEDLKIGVKISAFTKSNCICFVKDSTLLAIGMGMTSRVDAIRAAINKSRDLGISLKDSVMVSEAFFPFKDSVELASREGVIAILQPGGSIRDDEVVRECDKLGIAMYFSGVRHFLH